MDASRRIGAVMHRVVVGVVGLFVAVFVVAGCSSSTSGSGGKGGGFGGGGGGGGGGGSSAAVPTTGSGGGGGGGVSGGGGDFCSILKSGGGTSSLGGGATPGAKVVQTWDRLAAAAPAEIKADVVKIDQFLHSAFSGNPNPSLASDYASSVQRVVQWITTNCH